VTPFPGSVGSTTLTALDIQALVVTSAMLVRSYLRLLSNLAEILEVFVISKISTKYRRSNLSNLSNLVFLSTTLEAAI